MLDTTREGYRYTGIGLLVYHYLWQCSCNVIQYNMKTFILFSNGREFSRIIANELNRKLVCKLARQNNVSVKQITIKTL